MTDHKDFEKSLPHNPSNQKSRESKSAPDYRENLGNRRYFERGALREIWEDVATVKGTEICYERCNQTSEDVPKQGFQGKH